MIMKDMKTYYPIWKLKLWEYVINRHPSWCYTYADNDKVRHKILGIKID